jgi:periplasmic protein CpxP/Spy
MKIAHRLLITAGLLSLLAGTAFAQTAPAAAPDSQRPSRMEKMRERMTERHNKHLNELKAKLQLQTAQDASWTAFTQAMQPPATTLPRPDPLVMEKLTTPERIDQMLAFKAQRDAFMQKRADAAKTFYASLTLEQKKTFDTETAQFMAHRMGQGMAHGHPARQ